MEFLKGGQSPQNYHKKLTLDIAFQVNFQDLLKISKNTPLEFQHEMRKQGYPNFAINANNPIPADMQQIIPKINDLLNTYIFSSADPNRPYQIHLSKNFLTVIHSGPYEKGDDFKNRFDNILNSFVKTYEILDFTRVGLRHRNVINKKSIPNSDINKVKSFVPNDIFPELNRDIPEILYIDKKYGIISKGTTINAVYVWGNVSGNYGRIHFDNELSYFIDIDCFVQSNIQGVSNINEQYDILDRQYSSVFDWSVSSSLIKIIS